MGSCSLETRDVVGSPSRRVKGTGACVSWCVAWRTEREGRGGWSSRGSPSSCSFLPAASPDRRPDHHWSCARSLAVSGTAAGSWTCFLSVSFLSWRFSIRDKCSRNKADWLILTAALAGSRLFLVFFDLALTSSRPRPEWRDRPPTPANTSPRRPGRAAHGGAGGGEGAVADGQVHASAYLEPGRAPLRDFGPDGGLHRLLLRPLYLHLRAAVAGAAVPTQAPELPDGVPIPVPAVVGPAHRALLLLLQELCDSQHSGALPLLAALLLPSLPAVLHPQPHEPLLCTGESAAGGMWKQEVTLILKI